QSAVCLPSILPSILLNMRTILNAARYTFQLNFDRFHTPVLSDRSAQSSVCCFFQPAFILYMRSVYYMCSRCSFSLRRFSLLFFRSFCFCSRLCWFRTTGLLVLNCPCSRPGPVRWLSVRSGC